MASAATFPLFALGAVELAVGVTLLVPLEAVNKLGLSLCTLALRSQVGRVVCMTTVVFLVSRVHRLPQHTLRPLDDQLRLTHGPCWVLGQLAFTAAGTFLSSSASDEARSTRVAEEQLVVVAAVR
jgi:fumarate reductase subunit D